MFQTRDHMSNGNTLEKIEERRLLSILLNNTYVHKVAAFTRLVRIYKQEPEDPIIYQFLENFEYSNDDRTNILLDSIYNFLVSDGSSRRNVTIWNDRIDKIYKNEKIMEKLIKVCRLDSIQTNLFVLLSIILGSNTCKSEWLASIIKTFCCTNRFIILRLTSKIIAFSLEKKVEVNLNTLIMLKNRVMEYEVLLSKEEYRFVDDMTLKNIQRLTNIFKRQCLSFESYLGYLKEERIDKIILFANTIFLSSIRDDLDKKVIEIASLINMAIEPKKENIKLFLKHLLDLLECCPKFKNVGDQNISYERLFELGEEKDEETSYLATAILSKMLSFKISELPN